MSQYDNTNTGALFSNDKGDNPKRPDYKGKLNYEGQEISVSGWIKESKNGKKYLSLKLQAENAVASKTVEVEDDIPF
jgi:uncharacterized protein (DUF736 family)